MDGGGGGRGEGEEKEREREEISTGFPHGIGRVECEPPNNRLHKFVGTISMNEDGQPDGPEKEYSLDNDKILLRVSPCAIRHQHFIDLRTHTYRGVDCATPSGCMDW